MWRKVLAFVIADPYITACYTLLLYLLLFRDNNGVTLVGWFTLVVLVVVINRKRKQAEAKLRRSEHL